MPMLVCPKFTECQYREFGGMLIGLKGSQILCPTHNIPLIEEDMQASGFTVTGGGIEFNKDGITEISNSNLNVTGNVRNKGKMSFEDTDIKIEGDLENDGIFSMNEKKIILRIIEAMKSTALDTQAINNSLAELHDKTKDTNRWHAIINYIKNNVRLDFTIGWTGGIPHFLLKIGGK